MAARIAGVNIPVQKHIVIGLTSIYGIGRSKAAKICAVAKVSPDKKGKDLTEVELETLRTAID
jgi:small subunit ribosomal protein S13